MTVDIEPIHLLPEVLEIWEKERPFWPSSEDISFITLLYLDKIHIIRNLLCGRPVVI